MLKIFLKNADDFRCTHFELMIWIATASNITKVSKYSATKTYQLDDCRTFLNYSVNAAYLKTKREHVKF